MNLRELWLKIQLWFYFKKSGIPMPPKMKRSKMKDAPCPYCYDGTLRYERETGLLNCKKCHREVKLQGLTYDNC